MKKIIIFLFMFVLFLVSFCSAATLQGSIYNYNLEKLENAVVMVNTQPQQTYVAKNGTYMLNIPVGEYMIGAVYSNGEKLSISQKIVIKEEGDFILDLILVSNIDEEESILDMEDIDIGEGVFEKDYTWIWIVGIILAVFLVVAFVLMRPKKQEAVSEVNENMSKDDAEKVIEFIKKEGGRTTQKDIRKEFPSSEAKISLIITELESKGKIEKIKKGRGNIIKLK